MDIVLITNEHPDFYTLIGPFLARRHVDKAYGGRMWNEDGMAWFVALAPDREVMGFAALSPGKRELRVCNEYIRPEYREQGHVIQSQLIDSVLASCPANSTVIATADPSKRDLYGEKGFTLLRSKGKYPVMVKTVKVEVAHE
jgi:hypothetical protein